MNLSEIFTNPAIIWFIIGLVIIILELVIPGFVLLFFGAGAWITALVCLIFDISINLQLGIFTVSSVVLLVVLRKYLKNKFFSEDKSDVDSLEDEFIGKTAEVEQAIKKLKPGKVNFKGTLWTAKSDEDIEKGAVVKIIGKESINLYVKPIK